MSAMFGTRPNQVCARRKEINALYFSIGDHQFVAAKLIARCCACSAHWARRLHAAHAKRVHLTAAKRFASGACLERVERLDACLESVVFEHIAVQRDLFTLACFYFAEEFENGVKFFLFVCTARFALLVANHSCLLWISRENAHACFQRSDRNTKVWRKAKSSVVGNLDRRQIVVVFVFKEANVDRARRLQIWTRFWLAVFFRIATAGSVSVTRVFV